MTFEEAYAIYGPDVQHIAGRMCIDPPEADRLINDKLNRRYAAQKDKVYRATHLARSEKRKTKEASHLLAYAGAEGRGAEWDA